jgi:hypothetical protein
MANAYIYHVTHQVVLVLAWEISIQDISGSILNLTTNKVEVKLFL